MYSTYTLVCFIASIYFYIFKKQTLNFTFIKMFQPQNMVVDSFH